MFLPFPPLGRFLFFFVVSPVLLSRGKPVVAQGYLKNHSKQESMLLRINSPVSRFLIHARAALERVYHAHGISEEAVPFEALWLSNVVHAVDHVSAHDHVCFPLALSHHTCSARAVC
jgi:hypothetical protein